MARIVLARRAAARAWVYLIGQYDGGRAVACWARRTGRRVKPRHQEATVGAPLELDPRDARWLALVERHPGALPFHLPPWLDTVAECYGFEPFVLAIPDGAGGLAGGLPLMELAGPLGGRRWVALPFTDRCPALVADARAESALADGLRLAAASAGVGRVEVRAPLARLPAAVVAVDQQLDLSAGARAVERAFTPAARRGVRKARREGVVLRRGECEADLTRAFYRLHLATRRRVGAPVQPLRFFRLLWRRVLEPGHGHVLLACAAGEPIAGAVFLESPRTVVYKYGASDARAWRLRPNNLLFAEAIAAAAQRGAGRFDFGRTDFANDGLRAFKAGWGAREEALVHARLGAVPKARARGGATRLLGAVIRRTPAGVCRGIGEALYRYAA